MENPKQNHIPDTQKYLQERGEPHTKPQLENTKYNWVNHK